jgi:transcriptional regulator with XRE-family HTH domain
MNKIEKLQHIKKVCEEEDLTAYKIAQATGLSSVGIQKILNSETKNPNNSTLNIIMEYLEEKVLGIDIGKVQESEAPPLKSEIDLKKYVNCIERENKLTKEIHKLYSLLRKNNIEFKDFFEDEE